MKHDKVNKLIEDFSINLNELMNDITYKYPTGWPTNRVVPIENHYFGFSDNVSRKYTTNRMNQFVESTSAHTLFFGNPFGPSKTVCSESGMYVYVVGYPVEGGFRTVYYSHDYGMTWTVVSSPVDNVVRWEDLLMTGSSGQHVFGTITETTGNQVALVSHDYGVSWSVLFNGNIFCSSATGQYVYALNATLSKIVVSSDYGATWTETSLYPHVSCQTNDSGKYVYAFTSTNFYCSSDYGHTWSVSNPTITNFFPNNVYVSGSGSTIVFNGIDNNDHSISKTVVSNDYGATWQLVIEGNYHISDVSISNNGEAIYIASTNTDNSSFLFRSRNRGVSFSVMNTQSGTNWSGVETRGSGQTVYASGFSYADPTTTYCLVSYDYGSSWQQMQTPTGAEIRYLTLAKSGLYLYGYSRFRFYAAPTVDAPISHVCFPTGTPVSTDQGVVPIEQLDKSVHTIRGKPIVALTKTLPRDSYLVCFEPDCFCPGLPEKRTIMSKEHAVMYKGTWTKARKLVHQGIGKKIRNHGHPLYNILLGEKGACSVNGLLCETLHPQSGMARLYKDLETMTPEQKTVLIRDINHEMLRRFQARDEKRALAKRL